MNCAPLRLAATAVAALVLLAPHAHAGEGRAAVSVAVASNLKPAFDEIARSFEARNPGVSVKATYGASGAFLAQLRNGARFDLFLSADSEFPARVAELGLADGRPFTYAFGTLVVWVPRSSSLEFDRRGLAALLDPTVRKVAIANPHTAPYGRAAEAALRAAGVLDAVKSRFVLGQNASQAAQFAHTGNAQAAIIPLSLALAPPLSTDGRYWTLPAGTYEPIRQDGVLIKGAREARYATELVRFMTTGPARTALERFGYTVPSR